MLQRHVFLLLAFHLEETKPIFLPDAAGRSEAPRGGALHFKAAIPPKPIRTASAQPRMVRCLQVCGVAQRLDGLTDIQECLQMIRQRSAVRKRFKKIKPR